MSTPFNATALATTDTAKLHRLTIVMIRVLLGLDTPKPSTMRALIARGLYLVADQQGGAVISPEGVNVVAHMITEYDAKSGQATSDQVASFSEDDPGTWDEANLPDGYLWRLVSEKDGEQHLFAPDGRDVSDGYYSARMTGQAGEVKPGFLLIDLGQEQETSEVSYGPALPPEPVDDPAVAGVWALLNARNTVEGSKIIRGMVVQTPVIGRITVGKVQVWSETVHVQGKDDAGRPVELSLPSNHRITLVDAPEQLALI